jgi:O-antigen/teichoic acid export membrane protein
MLLAQNMLMSEYGEFSAAYSTVGIFALLAGIGFKSLVFREYAQGESMDDYVHLRGFREMAPIAICIASIACSVVLIVYHGEFHQSASIKFTSFVAVVLLVPITSLNAFFVMSASAHGKPNVANALSGWVLKGMMLVFIVGYVYVITTKISVLLAAGIYLLAYTLSFIGLLIVNSKAEPDEIKRGSKEFKFRQWIASGFLFSFSSFCSNILFMGGIILLNWVSNDSDAAAMFSIVAALCKFLASIVVSLGSVYRPKLAEAIANKSIGAVRQLIRSWSVAVFILVAVFMIVVFFAGKTILGIYGGDYANAYWALVVFAIGVSINSIVIIWRPLLQYMGRERQVMLVMAIVTLLAIGGMIFAGHHWAEFGVAVVAGSALAVCPAIMAVLGRRALCNIMTSTNSASIVN